MTTIQRSALKELWHGINQPTIIDFRRALDGTFMDLNTIEDAKIFYGALGRLTIKDQIMVHAGYTIKHNPVMVELFTQWLKLSQHLEDNAVKETQEIIDKTNTLGK